MSNVSRRHFVGASLAAASSLAVAPAVFAQVPASIKSLTIVVGFPPGGVADMIGRAVSEPLRRSLGAPVVVVNKPGAGARIAAEYVKMAPADGGIVIIAPASVLTLYPHIYKNLRYEPAKDFTPVTSAARMPLAIYVSPVVPADVKTADALVRWLTANPKFNSYAIPGLGTTPHLAGMLFGRAAKLDWVPVAYQGGAPVIMAVMSSEVAVGFSAVGDGIEHVRSGKLRLLATTGPQRSEFLSEVPTLAEQGYANVTVEERQSFWVAKQTPAPLVARLNAEIRAALQTKEVSELLIRQALEPSGESAEEFARMMRDESEHWRTTVKALNFSME